MVIIADSGSTKTDWVIINTDTQAFKEVVTEGINPYFQTKDQIVTLLRKELLPAVAQELITEIRFYGAGVANEAQQEQIVNAFLQIFPCSKVFSYSDLVGASLSLFGDQKGIAAIMGTGSNSCLWSGTEIIQQISPLGFILGDEGSGAVLGKNLIGDCLKNQLPTSLKEDLFSFCGLTQGEIIAKVYKEPFPNRFLASFAPFIKQHIDEPLLQKMVRDSFLLFFKRNICQYAYQDYPVRIVGSVAFYFQQQLLEAATEVGVKIEMIQKSPVKMLVNRYLDIK